MIAAAKDRVFQQWHHVLYLVAVIVTALWFALRPSHWRRTVWLVLRNQVFFTGVQGLRFVLLVAVLMGVAVVLQAQIWLTKAGQSEYLGPLLVAVLIRELGPLLVNIIIIVRSGSAIVAELGNMSAAGEVRALDAQGVDPFVYLVMPRVLGLAFAAGCLMLLFVTAALISGYIFGSFLAVNAGYPVQFVNNVLEATERSDIVRVLVKTFVPALTTGAICCIHGSTAVHATDVPKVTTRALSWSVAVLFIISVGTSVIMYL